jgi:hypothetical protein
MKQHNDGRRISYRPSKRYNAIYGRLPHQGSIDEWYDRLAAKEVGPNNNDPIQPTLSANAFTGNHDAQEAFYTRLGAHDEATPLPSH